LEVFQASWDATPHQGLKRELISGVARMTTRPTVDLTSSSYLFGRALAQGLPLLQVARSSATTCLFGSSARSEDHFVERLLADGAVAKMERALVCGAAHGAFAGDRATQAPSRRLQRPQPERRYGRRRRTHGIGGRDLRGPGCSCAEAEPLGDGTMARDLGRFLSSDATSRSKASPAARDRRGWAWRRFGFDSGAAARRLLGMEDKMVESSTPDDGATCGISGSRESRPQRTLRQIVMILNSICMSRRTRDTLRRCSHASARWQSVELDLVTDSGFGGDVSEGQGHGSGSAQWKKGRCSPATSRARDKPINGPRRTYFL